MLLSSQFARLLHKRHYGFSLAIRPYFVYSSCHLHLLCSIKSETPGQSVRGLYGKFFKLQYSDAAKLSHLQLLSSIIPREERDRLFIRHSYQHSFSGFSAMLTKDETSILLGIFCPLSFPAPSPEKRRINNDIVEILEDKKLHDFELYNLSTGFSFLGIWPELPSFSDRGVGKIPSRWKGECMEGPNFKKSNCNR
ncbi:unnamed protein product [Coffea canephora]|uniref:DH200=94 genomic scaffold, scaffold_987 n=1 Tax=Coffea canephora TaxID=49390 RepID=A0A068VKM5_COFCA|nr:unnamed protein product [Coffea canephora]